MLTEQPPTTASCCTWFKNAGGNNCFQRALDGCAISTVQLVWSVPQSGRDAATSSACVRLIHRSETFVLAIPFTTDVGPDIRVQLPRARAADQQPPQGSQLVPSDDPLDDSPPPNCPIRDTTSTERDKQVLTDLPGASMALPRCVIFRYATAWTEYLEGAMSGHRSWALLSRFRCSLFLTSPVGNGGQSVI